MEIIVGKLAGFCGGVINSVAKSEKLLEEYGEMYCLGELVHNKQVVDKLQNKGLKVVETLDEVPDNSMVIIRAHGVEKEIYEEADKRNIKIFDLTCPKVLKIHDQAINLVKDDNYVVLVAQKNHPEAIGTMSFCGEDSIILESEDDLPSVVESILKSKKKNVAIISQTTFSVLKFEKLTNELCRLLGDKLKININNTICSATEMRQKETKEISSQVDAMIIIGGRNSSNTKKLYDLSLMECSDSFIIETIEDLDINVSKYKKVGVMAGASTPKESIDEVIKYLQNC